MPLFAAGVINALRIVGPVTLQIVGVGGAPTIRLFAAGALEFPPCFPMRDPLGFYSNLCTGNRIEPSLCLHAQAGRPRASMAIEGGLYLLPVHAQGGLLL